MSGLGSCRQIANVIQESVGNEWNGDMKWVKLVVGSMASSFSDQFKGDVIDRKFFIDFKFEDGEKYRVTIERFV